MTNDEKMTFFQSTKGGLKRKTTILWRGAALRFFGKAETNDRAHLLSLLVLQNLMDLISTLAAPASKTGTYLVFFLSRYNAPDTSHQPTSLVGTSG